jgi:hypothetical protein
MGTAISDLIRIQMTGFVKTQTARVDKLLALCSTPLSATFDENSKAKESERNHEFGGSAVLSGFRFQAVLRHFERRWQYLKK